MDRPRRGLVAELVAVGLMVGCLGGTLAAVVAIHRRRSMSIPPASPPVAVAEAVPAVVSAPPPKPAARRPAPPPPPPIEPEDPTAKVVAELARAVAEQRAEAAGALRRVASLEAAALSAKAESEKWKRGTAMARAQLSARTGDALRAESLADTAVMERDALARRRDALKRTLEADRARPSYAVLPHKGPNGTWQRPIVLECSAGAVALRPGGPTFDLMEIIAPLGRSSPFAAMVSREAVKVQRQSSPDGGEVTPYIFFIVRPDGIRAYYEARSRLERLGIAFGYELADADWAIDVPSLDQHSTWDGSPPPAGLDGPLASELPGSGPSSGPEALRGGGGGVDNAFVWPRTPAGMDREGTGQGTSRIASAGQGMGSRPGPFGDLPTPVPSGGSPASGTGSGRNPSGGSGTGRDAGRRVWDRALRLDDPGRPVGLEPLGATEGGGTGPSEGAEGPRRPGSRAGGGSVAQGGDGSEANGTGSGVPGGNPGGQGTGSGGQGTGSGGQGDGGPGGQEGTSGGQGGGGSGPAGGREGASGGGPGGIDPGQGGGGKPSLLGDPAYAPRAFGMVLACGPKGVAVHPGDYRVTRTTLAAKRSLLVDQVRAIVREKERSSPGVTLMPSLRFVVEPGGQEAYTTARAQLALAGIDWPSTVTISGGDTPRLFSTDAW